MLWREPVQPIACAPGKTLLRQPANHSYLEFPCQGRNTETNVISFKTLAHTYSQAMQVILAMPDRQETVSFLETAAAHGVIFRLLHHIQKPDLLTPVSIYQFIFRPVLSPDILQLVSGEDSSAAHSLAVGSKGFKAVSASTHSPPTQSLVNEATGLMPSWGTVSPEVDTNLMLPSGTLSYLEDPEPCKTFSVSTPGEAGVNCCPAPAGAVPQPILTKGQTGVPATLLVLDFDWSMIEDNSDTFVVHELGAWEAFQRCGLLQHLDNSLFCSLGF